MNCKIKKKKTKLKKIIKKKTKQARYILLVLGRYIILAKKCFVYSESFAYTIHTPKTHYLFPFLWPFKILRDTQLRGYLI